MPTYITHEKPVLRRRTTYIAQIDLTPYGFPETFEQVWLEGDATGSYRLCCIPFRAYGVALHDTVSLDPSRALVAAVTRKSGHRALRVLLAPAWRVKPSSPLITGLLDAVADSAFAHEWSGDRHIAVDVPPGADADLIVEMAQRAEQEQAAWWEWSDAIPLAS